MNCREFERVLDAYVTGELAASESEAAGRHLHGCPACTDLLELARIASQPVDPAAARPPASLVAEVLERTVGSGCPSAERSLCDWVDRRLDAERRRLVATHLERCDDCRALAGALAALAVDLPSLAEIQPDSRFVDSVLAATLPWSVRLRRWWRSAWPRWVQRPRFAAEAAYVTTLALVLIFSTPGSPLQAMPEQAIELARRTAPARSFSDPLGRLEAAALPRLEALRNAEGTRAVVGSFRTTVELGSEAAGRSLEIGGRAYSWVSENLRTLWDRLASLLERAGDTPSSAEHDSDEETA